MRAVLGLLALIAAAACAPQSAGCAASATQAFEFADAERSVRTETIGPNCHQAIALYSIRNSDGDVLWAWTAPLQRAFGDVFANEPDEHLQAFLTRWAEPVIATTQAAPAWDALEHGQTTLDQLTYADIRARDLPMLCHYSGTSRQVCVFWEPAAGSAGHFYDRDAEETEL
jgi:hypothetical protein